MNIFLFFVLEGLFLFINVKYKVLFFMINNLILGNMGFESILVGLYVLRNSMFYIRCRVWIEKGF